MFLVGAGFFLGHGLSPTIDQAPPTLPPPPSLTPAPNAVVEAALDRSALLEMVARAADAFASNVPMPAGIDAAEGRRFELVLPFGCEAPGAVESPGEMGWRFDPKAGTLRVAAAPVTWRGDEWTDGPASDPPLRGFWIARPWSNATRCAELRKGNVDIGGEAVVLPEQTVAIARLIDAEDAGKKRSYEVVRRSTRADFDPAQGFRLRIVGRIRSLPGRGPINCVQPGGADHPPRCVITAAVAEVQIENGMNSAVLARWSVEDAAAGPDDLGGRS